MRSPSENVESPVVIKGKKLLKDEIELSNSLNK